MVILTGEQMRVAEKMAVKAGTSYEQLMENAGYGAADAIKRRYGQLLTPGAHLLILLGRGNNGGDGLVIARALLQWQPELTFDLVFCLGHQLSSLASLNLARLEEYPQIHVWDDADHETLTRLCQKSCLILDGIFGTGFHGQLPESVALAVRTANQSTAKRIALDIPTGVNGDNGITADDSFQADFTCTFAAKKPAHILKSSRYLCGEMEIIEIGIHQEILNQAGGITLLETKLIREMLPPRRPDSNKGSYGRLLIAGGCRTMTGAVLLAAEAAARCGAGLVMAAAPEHALLPIRIRLPEALQFPLTLAESGAVSPEAHPLLLEKANRWATAILCGCGMSLTAETELLVSSLLESCHVPMVLDADALNALSKIGVDKLKKAQAPVILTPHMMEFSRLSGLTIDKIRENRFEIAARFAQEYGVTLVLKDATTVIASNGQLFINENGNSGLSKGGSGDTLGGMIAAFLAQGVSAQAAALCGVFMHAAAGDIAAEKLTAYAMLPQDVIGCLPDAFKQILF